MTAPAPLPPFCRCQVCGRTCSTRPTDPAPRCPAHRAIWTERFAPLALVELREAGTT